jgi:transposase-like protein
MSNICPQCESKAIKRNGYTRHGKQNHRCLDCGRQFSLEPALQDEQTVISAKMEEFECCEQ